MCVALSLIAASVTALILALSIVRAGRVMDDPEIRLSNDVLSMPEARRLADQMLEDVLSGRSPHPIDIERLCCAVIKSGE